MPSPARPTGPPGPLGPSTAWATVSDEQAGQHAGQRPGHGGQGGPELGASHPARQRIEASLGRALMQLGQIGGLAEVSVGEPVAPAADVDRDDPGLQAQLRERLGPVAAQGEVVGWIAMWPVTAVARDGTSSGRLLLAAQDEADLDVEVADWLQTVAADLGDPAPRPPCPGHPHPMRPVAQDGQAWWACPSGSTRRPW